MMFLNCAATAKLHQMCPTLCDPIDGSPPGPAIPGILQARTLEWVCHFLPQCSKVKSEREVAQSCPTLSDPMDCSPPGSSIHGIFQARVLEWGAIAFSGFKLWCWRILLRVPWTARRSNQSILKEINPECSLKGLMLKLKFQYFSH